MIFVCSVVLADKAFTLQFAGKMLSLSAGDVLLIDDTDREDFQPHAAHITEVRLDENIIRRYLESCGGNREADNTVSSGFIRVAFAHPALLRDVMHHLNSGGFVHPGFSEQMFFSCIAVFASKKGFLPLLLGGMLSVAGRVRHIICTDLSRQWKLRDVSSRLYMSESQLKKKLKEEGCSFTGVLLDVRMGYARRLLQARLPVNRVAAQCGYVSTSYFICVFRECFGVTPHRILALQEHGQHKSEC